MKTTLSFEDFKNGLVKPGEIADAIGDPKYNSSAVSGLFTGQRLTVPLVREVARAFGVTPAEVLEEVRAGAERRMDRVARRLG